MRRLSISSSPDTANSCCSSRVCPGARRCCGVCRPGCFSIGIVILGIAAQRRSRASPGEAASLSAAEEARVAEILRGSSRLLKLQAFCSPGLKSLDRLNRNVLYLKRNFIASQHYKLLMSPTERGKAEGSCFRDKSASVTGDGTMDFWRRIDERQFPAIAPYFVGVDVLRFWRPRSPESERRHCFWRRIPRAISARRRASAEFDREGPAIAAEAGWLRRHRREGEASGDFGTGEDRSAR